jgi:hypothetical protein
VGQSSKEFRYRATTRTRITRPAGIIYGGCKIIHSQGVRATAVIMQWNTIPAQLQRELFDTAGSMGELLRTSELRGQIARFLHHHKDDGIRDGSSSTVAPST